MSPPAAVAAPSRSGAAVGWLGLSPRSPRAYALSLYTSLSDEYREIPPACPADRSASNCRPRCRPPRLPGSAGADGCERRVARNRTIRRATASAVDRMSPVYKDKGVCWGFHESALVSSARLQNREVISLLFLNDPIAAQWRSSMPNSTKSADSESHAANSSSWTCCRWAVVKRAA